MQEIYDTFQYNIMYDELHRRNDWEEFFNPILNKNHYCLQK